MGAWKISHAIYALRNYINQKNVKNVKIFVVRCALKTQFKKPKDVHFVWMKTHKYKSLIING